MGCPWSGCDGNTGFDGFCWWYQAEGMVVEILLNEPPTHFMSSTPPVSRRRCHHEAQWNRDDKRAGQETTGKTSACKAIHENPHRARGLRLREKAWSFIKACRALGVSLTPRRRTFDLPSSPALPSGHPLGRRQQFRPSPNGSSPTTPPCVHRRDAASSACDRGNEGSQADYCTTNCDITKDHFHPVGRVIKSVKPGILNPGFSRQGYQTENRINCSSSEGL